MNINSLYEIEKLIRDRSQRNYKEQAQMQYIKKDIKDDKPEFDNINTIQLCNIINNL